MKPVKKTYGSYMRKQDSLTSSVLRIGGFDLGVSFIAGLLIVSAAFVAAMTTNAITMPRAFPREHCRPSCTMETRVSTREMALVRVFCGRIVNH